MINLNCLAVLHIVSVKLSLERRSLGKLSAPRLLFPSWRVSVLPFQESGNKKVAYKFLSAGVAPPAMCLFAHSLTTQSIVKLLNFCQSDRWEMVFSAAFMSLFHYEWGIFVRAFVYLSKNYVFCLFPFFSQIFVLPTLILKIPL